MNYSYYIGLPNMVYYYGSATKVVDDVVHCM